jgi:K+-sensing histidine kinase KdpD
VTDVPALVEERAERIRERFPQAEVRVESGDDVAVRAIPALADAVTELLENAVEHNDADTPTVSVEIVTLEDARGAIRLRDNGAGIPEIERRTILADHEMDQLHHSTGLGILFAYWVIWLSDGTLSIESNEPRGSLVTLTLPTAIER